MIKKNEAAPVNERPIWGTETPDNLVFGVIPPSILANPIDFIDTSRKGIPGLWVRHAIDATGLRDTFLSLLGITPARLSRLYREESLSRSCSESVLDAARVIQQAEVVWESREQALNWLQCPLPALGDQRPIDLFDTFEGRRWVSRVLNNIEYGEFS